MICDNCGMEYPKTFKHKDKKNQLLKWDIDPGCVYIIFESIEEQPIKGQIKGMVVKFETGHTITLGRKCKKGAIIGTTNESEEINALIAFNPSGIENTSFVRS